jgi:hypothetical protein
MGLPTHRGKFAQAQSSLNRTQLTWSWAFGAHVLAYGQPSTRVPKMALDLEEIVTVLLIAVLVISWNLLGREVGPPA